MLREIRFATHFDPDTIATMQRALNTAMKAVNVEELNGGADEMKTSMARVILARAARGETDIGALTRHAVAATL